MKSNFYIIHAKTNIHVGSGDSNFGVVDNLIQRDVITNLPVIHGSSLKGALREYFERDDVWDKDNKIKYIFGNSSDDKNNSSPGNYYFLEAQLLALPVRSNKKPYFMATCPMILKNFLQALEGNVKDDGDSMENNFFQNLINIYNNIKPQKEKPVVFSDNSDLIIEDFEGNNLIEFKNFDFTDEFKSFFGIEDDNLVIFNDDDFKILCNDSNLPVIARNQLENGKSKNLWYEQVVPRESRFWVNIIASDKDEIFNEFNRILTDKKKFIPIGANITVGYGLTKFIEVKL